MQVKGVIFDIGGVLFKTYQEHMFFDPNRGVIDRYKLDKEKAASATAKIWNKYAYEQTNYLDWKALERNYWQEFNSTVGITIPESEWNQISDEFAEPISGAKELLEQLNHRQMDLLICSNNTEFWWQREKEKLLGRYFKPEKVILSNRIGEKKTGPEQKMFKSLISALDYPVENYLYVDDDFANLKAALTLGIIGILFPTDNPDGMPYLRKMLL